MFQHKHKVDTEDESSVQAQQSRGLWVRDQILSEQIETNKGGGVQGIWPKVCIHRYLIFLDWMSLYSPGNIEAHFVDNAGLKLRESLLPGPPECWDFKVCVAQILNL